MSASIWWTIPIFVGLIGLLSLVGGLGRMMKLRLMTGGMRTIFGGVLLTGAAVLGLVGLNLQTYARLTHETLAAEVTLKQTGVQSYTAEVKRANKQGTLGEVEEYQLTGDSFRMEADVIVFKPWANVIGVDALYRFDRIQGRYDSESQEEANPPKAYSLRGEETGLSVFQVPLGTANPFQSEDAEFINGVAVPMADTATYELMMSQKGLIPRAKNEAADIAIKERRAGRESGSIYNSPLNDANITSGGTQPTP